MSEIASFFKLDTLSIGDFFSSDKTGYYIPLYQRKYSWGEANVVQLMADVCYGVENLIGNLSAFHFMGTVILVSAKSDDTAFQGVNQRGMPKQILKIIDGQQRISTLALLGCQLYKRLHTSKQGLPPGSEYLDLAVAISNWQKDVYRLFSFDLGRGNPKRKPIVIRGENDEWSEIDSGQTTYCSDVANYLSLFISSIDKSPSNPVFPALPSAESLRPVLHAIDVWLDKVVNAHLPNSDEELSPAWEILKGIPQNQLWDYARPEIVSVVNQRSSPLTLLEAKVCSITQLLAFCYYLLRRCGFTVILPTTEDGAFDMFQSLNATGTPLTAIETFKPLVVNAADKYAGGYPNSILEYYYDNVDELFSKPKTTSAKNTLTNEFVTTLAVMHDGSKLPSQFSSQRMWLTKCFGECKTITAMEEFVRRMGDLAIYWNEVVGFNPATQVIIERTDNKALIGPIEAKEAALCVLFLKDANHSMANSVLGRFHAQILRERPNSELDFVRACKAVAAFFVLWRASLPNKDLDDVYRKLLANQISWQRGDNLLTVPNLKTQLYQALKQKLLGSNLTPTTTDDDVRKEWMVRARQDLRYDVIKTVCKFALLVAAHDTEPDPSEVGLVRIAASKTDPHLFPAYWESSDFKSIEHVAPQRRENNSNWDENIYINGYQQRIGNLILLPEPINSTVGNKPWIEKWIYYQYLSLTNVYDQQQLEQIAQANGITLGQRKALKHLKEAGHQKHIRAVVALGQNGQWDHQLIAKRTERICEILWKRMMDWLK